MTDPGDHLNALDATFLELEEADSSAHMHIGGVMIFEPHGDGGAPPIERIRAELEARTRDLPRYRQRLSATHTGGFTGPPGSTTIASTSRGTSSRRDFPSRGARP